MKGLSPVNKMVSQNYVPLNISINTLLLLFYWSRKGTCQRNKNWRDRIKTYIIVKSTFIRSKFKIIKTFNSVQKNYFLSTNKKRFSHGPLLGDPCYVISIPFNSASISIFLFILYRFSRIRKIWEYWQLT